MRTLIRTILSKIRRRHQALHRLAKLGRSVMVMDTAILRFHQNIKIGDYVRIGHDCVIDGEGGVEIGDGTILAARVTILSTTHCYNQKDYLPFNEKDEYRPVRLGRGVWIGWGAMICPGVIIGDGAIVAMGAVVSNNVGKGEVVGGNPAKKIKTRNLDQISKMIEKKEYYLKAVKRLGKSRRN